MNKSSSPSLPHSLPHSQPQTQTQRHTHSLPPFLQNILDNIRKQKQFNAKEWIEDKTDKLNIYMRNAGLSACVIAVSGGIDSAVTYKLANYAMNKVNSPIKKVLGLALPIKSTEKVWTRALNLDTCKDCNRIYAECSSTNESQELITNGMEIYNQLGSSISVLDQSSIFDDIIYEVRNKVALWNIPKDSQKFADGQLKSYMRTPINYYVAQLLSAAGLPAIVLGTGNKDEDRYLAYFCKAGDGVVDVQLISDLHKSEVFTIGKELNVPENILNAPPTADLWEGQTDEDELGFSYDFVELLLEYHDMSLEKQKDFKVSCILNDMKSETIGSVWDYFVENKTKAEKIHNRNKHKLNFPVNL